MLRPSSVPTFAAKTSLACSRFASGSWRDAPCPATVASACVLPSSATHCIAQSVCIRQPTARRSAHWPPQSLPAAPPAVASALNIRPLRHSVCIRMTSSSTLQETSDHCVLIYGRGHQHEKNAPTDCSEPVAVQCTTRVGPRETGYQSILFGSP